MRGQESREAYEARLKNLCSACRLETKVREDIAIPTPEQRMLLFLMKDKCDCHNNQSVPIPIHQV